MNESTNFQIASNSKAFTTAARSILVNEGKLKWTYNVKEIIAEFKIYNEYVTDNFNIVDLVSHRSGLGIGAGDIMFIPDDSDSTLCSHQFQYFKPQSAFRTRFDYDNVLYIVAGEVIVRIRGMDYESFIREIIFFHLEMSNAFIGSVKNKSNLAIPNTSISGI